VSAFCSMFSQLLKLFPRTEGPGLTALIAMLLLKYLQLKARFAWSCSNLVALLRMNLFTHRDLWAWLDRPFEGPPAVLVTVQEELALA